MTSLRASLGGNREASLGAVFVVQAEEMGGFRVALPDGEMGLLAQSDAQPAGAALRVAGGDAVVADARRFLGVPFLWGGVTWRGIDCSGLVQAVHRRFLRLLPRDAGAQESAGRAVEPDELRAGDLLCYGDHIAIATERGTIIHAYGQAGGVVETPHLDELQSRLRTVRRVFETQRPESEVRVSSRALRSGAWKPAGEPVGLRRRTLGKASRLPLGPAPCQACPQHPS